MGKKSEVFDLLKKQFHDGHLGHAFLLETNQMQRCYDEVINFLQFINCDKYSDNCSKCNLCHLIKTCQLPSLVVINPIGNVIKKEQILDLKRCFQTKATFSTYRMYIIMNAQFLNASSANTMLKFLEEPDEQIIGFFITDNKENVIDTIKSRCQIYLNYYDEVKNDLPFHDLALEYIINIEKEKAMALFYQKNYVLPCLKDKNDVFLFLKSLFIHYSNLLKYKVSNDELSSIYEPISFLLEDVILKRLSLVEKMMENVFFNANTQLMLDAFVLESEDVA